MLMTVVKSLRGLTYVEMIREMDKELTEVIEDFNHAVIVEGLHETSKLSFSQSVNS